MITNKDVRVENGNLVLNGDKFPLDGQSPETIMEIVEDNSDSTPTENSTKPVKSGGIYSKIGDLTQTGLTGDSVAAQFADVVAQFANFEVKTWTPKIYDLNTYKRDAPAQKYIKIGGLYVMFMEGTFDFSDISTIIVIQNLPCATCVSGTIFIGDLKQAAINTKGNSVQGDGKGAYIRPNVTSSDLNTPASAPRNKFVFFGYDL